MPDLANRRQREADMTAAIMLLFGRHVAAMRSGSRLSADPPDELAAALFLTANQSGSAMVGSYKAPAEGLAAPLRQWSENYARVLAREVTETTEAMRAAHVGPITAEVLAAWTVTLGSRADNIGITETTRAVTVGESTARGYIDEIDGTTLTPIWYTENDARVCEVCDALHGTGPEVYGDVNPDGPPAHPRCRCWLEWEQKWGGE